jgi:23S rRNA (uracil1939-C5)-methyltransferase
MTQTNSKKEFVLEITALSYGPYGIGRANGEVVMVPETVPGDRVGARIRERKKNYAIGSVVELLNSSPWRRSPPCPHVRECGGCPWQQLRYEGQLQAKQRSVGDALKRIAKVDAFDLRPIISSPLEYHYRRRVRFQCDHERRLGFFRPFSHELVEIQSCAIADPAINSCIPALRNWVQRLQTAAEQVEIVTGDQSGELVVVVFTRRPFMAADDVIYGNLLREQPQIRGIIFHGDERRACGQTKLTVMTEEGIHLFVEADAFTQVNREGNQTIVKELVSAGAFEGSDRVLELYCGAGNFTLSIARRVGQIIAVEGHRPSIESGKRCAQLNDLNNIKWIIADVPRATKRLLQRGERFSKIVLDPPRAGAKGIERDVAAFGAEQIFYISCNPTTLARDIAALIKQGYKLGRVQPIDLFPQTFHVETLAMLTR